MPPDAAARTATNPLRRYGTHTASRGINLLARLAFAFSILFLMSTVAQAQDASLTGGERVEPLKVGRVSANLFALLGVPPALGRTWSAEEEDHRMDIPLSL